MSNYFEIIVFTASRKEYAEKAINLLDPSNIYISNILTQEHCTLVKSLYVKDLRIFEKDRTIDEVIIIDNLINSFAFQLENGIPIRPYMEGIDDIELRTLASKLKTVNEYGSVRQFLKKSLKLDEFFDFCYKFSFNGEVCV